MKRTMQIQYTITEAGQFHSFTGRDDDRTMEVYKEAVKAGYIEIEYPYDSGIIQQRKLAYIRLSMIVDDYDFITQSKRDSINK